MNTEDFRQLYQYHFHLNHKIWDEIIQTLPAEQFTQDLPYSVGSVRNQLVHLLSIEERWFSGLRGEEVPGFANPEYYPNRELIRQKWDTVEAQMKSFLAGLDDEKLKAPFGEDILVWQVLIQVLGHGIDHRAQLLAMLNQLGAQTFSQDYALYLFGKI